MEKEKIYRKWEKLKLITSEHVANDIKIPGDFCFKTNFEIAFGKIKQVANCIFQNAGNSEIITLDFSKCKKADTAALFVLQVLRLELDSEMRRLMKRNGIENIKNQFNVIKSKSKDVNRLLAITGFLEIEVRADDEEEDDSTLIPIHHLGYLKASRNRTKNKSSDKRDILTDKVINYLEDCLNSHGYTFSSDEDNFMRLAVGEILGNAEDHCQFGKWYITGNFSQEDVMNDSKQAVGEINLTVVNFGGTMYERYLSTRKKNYSQFQRVVNKVNDVLNKNSEAKYDEEQMFTVAMIQDQISRLKYQDESRGAGTIRFIRSFLDLGDYVNEEKGYMPNISIVSGKTFLNIDHSCAPKLNNGIYTVVLNKEQNRHSPPEEPYVVCLKDKFPGTLISTKIYFNTKHFDTKFA